MAVTQLSLYNQALALVGERKIGFLGANSESELLLDLHYEEDPTTIESCLEMVMPDFAMLTAQLGSPSVPSNNGYAAQYSLPTNYLSLAGVFVDDNLSEPTDRYVIEGRNIATNSTPNVWIRYVRNDAPLSEWTPSFGNVVAAYLALQIAPRFAPQKIDKIKEEFLSRVEVAVTIETRKKSQTRPIDAQFTPDAETLKVYNQAIAMMGLTDQVTNVAQETPLTTALNAVMANGAVEYLLEVAKPRFAIKTVNSNTGPPSSEHDLDNVHNLPADYLALVELHENADMDSPITRYMIEGNTVATNRGSIFIRYVRNTVTSADWTTRFKQLLAIYLAEQVKSQFVTSELVLNWLAEEYSAKLQTNIEVDGAEEPQGRRTLDSEYLMPANMKLVYNNALALLGQPPLKDTFETNKVRIAFDTIIQNGGIELMLEVAKPRFAMRTVTLTGGSTSPNHGYDNVFSLPADYIGIVELHSDEKLDQPINRYLIEGETIATEYATVYLRYISSDAAVSVGALAWTPAFKNLLAAYLADECKAEFASSMELHDSISKAYESRLAWIISNESIKEPERSRRPTASLSEAWRQIYNDALLILGLDHIVSVDDDSQRRVALDAALATGTVAALLEDINWGFATVSSKLTYNPSIEPAWGYTRAFDYPADLHRLDDIFHDEHFTTPLTRYEDEGDRIFCDLDDIYIKYVTTDFLTNPTNWPQYFKRYVAAELAMQVCGQLRGDKNNAIDQFDRRQAEAKNTDAMTRPPQKIRDGSWSISRGASSSRRRNFDGRP